MLRFSCIPLMQLLLAVSAITTPVMAQTISTNELIKLFASDNADVTFGHSLSISGDTLAIGLQNLTGIGAAYIFQDTSPGADWSTFTQIRLIASDGTAGDFFGDTLAISGDTLVVSAGLHINESIRSGSAYVFERNAGGADNWGESAILTASDGAMDDFFGGPIAIDGDTVLIGASGVDDLGTSSGSAYIFERNAGGADNWGEVTKLTASDGAANDFFGGTTAIDGDTVVVGAVGNNSITGSTYIFERNQGGVDNWGEVVKLTASDGTTDDFFGASVSIDGDTVVVAATGDDNVTGSAYIFERNQGGVDNWGEVVKLTASDGATNDTFGWRVAISGDTVVVGPLRASSAYIFERNDGGADNWGEVAILNKSDGTPDESFGFSVAIDGNTVAVGALDDNAGGTSTGSVYVFNITSSVVEDDDSIEEAVETRVTAAGFGADDFDQGGVPGAIRGEGAPELIEVSAGEDHNLGLRNDGSVVGWGRDQFGQTTVPEGLAEVSDIDTGYNHNLAVISDGTVVAWGNNDSGQTDVPAGLSDVVAVSAGGSHSLALLSDGTVIGWGNNDNGQATPPGDLTNVSALSAGGFHNLALKDDGTVVAWGLNDSGQTDVPTGLTNVTEISAGDKHSLALTEDSNTVAWGDNTFGQLDVPFSAVPASLSAKNKITAAFNASAVTSIAAGLNHNLALDADGEVIGWGLNDSGQAEIPEGLFNVSAITAGGRHNVVLNSVAQLILDGSGDVAGENIEHPNTNVFDQVLLTGEFIQLQAKTGQIIRVSFMDEDEDIVQVEFSGAGTFTVTLDPATFLSPALPPRYNQQVEYVTGKPSVVIDGADSSTFFSIFTVGTINAVNQALFPEGQVYDAQADVTLVEVINSTGIGGMQLSNTVFTGDTGNVGVDARGVPIAVRLTVGDIDADGDAVPHLLFGDGSFTTPAGNPGLRITGGGPGADKRGFDCSGRERIDDHRI